MNPAARDRLVNPLGAFDQPATAVLLAVALAPLAAAPVVLRVFRRVIPAPVLADAWRRYTGWLVVVPVMAAAVLIGPGAVIAGATILSLLSFREFARVTGLFREKFICYLVVAGIAAAQFAALDNWYGLFAATFPLTTACVAGFAAAQDRPKGYLQRVALGTVAFGLFGSCLGHLGFLAAADAGYRPRLALVLVAVGFWDVARYVVGRAVGGPKLSPHTNPERTVSGAVGGAVVVVGFVMAAGWFVFDGTGLHDPARLAGFGLLIAVAAQLGDLMLAAIKADAGVGNLDPLIPGHGGLLDRFDSLILVAPVAYHVIHFFAGAGAAQSPRVFTGG
ncbi:MAG: phosphatidate cytidylyltransferase [Gemmataceae bacterium]|nr:phosphatidate cytidylyltransferase [Gemmataceae bacterium]